MAPSYTAQDNVLFLPPARLPSPPPPDFAIDGCRRTGQTRIRDRWFGLPAVEEKVIYECGEARWHRIRPPYHPISPLCGAVYLAFPIVWVAAGLGLWWLL
jgi:hypothetical protein